MLLLKDHILDVLCLPLISSSFFSSLFLLFCCLSYWFPCSSCSLVGLVNLACIAEFPCSADLVTETTLVCMERWPPQTVAPEEVSGDVMVACHYNTFCCWRSLNMLVIVTVVQTASILYWISFSLTFGLGLGFSFSCLLMCFQRWNLHNFVISTS